MGLFDKLFNKNKMETTNTTTLLPGNFRTENTLVNILNINPDIRDLVWIGDGKNQNYIQSNHSNTINIDGIRITMSMMNQEEPSLLYLRLPISTNINPQNIERPPYYPTYKDLTPAQKGLYWKLLSNPYDSSIDIGYVFILYYGLERHLLAGDFEKAFDIIIKMRDIHSNKSFQNYSGNALILTCIYHQRPDLVYKFMASLNNEHEYNFSDNLFLLSKYSLNIALNAKDIIRLAKSFEFTTLNYIKNYPVIFEEVLNEELRSKFNSEEVFCNSFINKSDFNKLRKQTVPIFANISIISKSIDVPMIVESFKLKKEMNALLCRTHEKVKIQLAEMRKNGTLDSLSSNEKREKEVPTFDTSTEKELLKNYNKCRNSFMDLHFALIILQDFYYKNRNIDPHYLEKCVQYCCEDIDNLEKMQTDYYRKEVSQINSLIGIYSKSEIQKQINNIQKFNGNIPAFKRLAIIHEKQKDYSKAIRICDQAIEYYNMLNLAQTSSEFVERKQKLLIKTEK